MIVGLCGFGYTGSGAVYDLLREYEGITMGNHCEVSFLYRPDGLGDLRYHLTHPVRFFSSDYAIQRFRKKIHNFFRNSPGQWGLKDYTEVYKLTDEFLESIIDVKWKGWWSDDESNMEGIRYVVYRIVNWLTVPFPVLNIKVQRSFYYRDMFLSVNPEQFMEKSQKYLNDLFSLFGYDIEKDTLVLDQPFSADCPSATSVFFKNAKAIIVDKDPRDLYLLLKKESFVDCAWTPTDNVNDFIAYYKQIRRNYSDIVKEKELIIRFENLIYEYEATIQLIENYLGLDKSKHIHKKCFFDPKKSINNTQLFRKYPEMKNDIEIIENELGSYLFDFDKYPPLTTFGKAF